jgi:tetratricopeptide (TPR) repeat protein
LARLDREQDNLRAVLRGAIGRGDAELALRLADGLAWFWGEWAQAAEGRRWVTAALGLAGAAVPSAARARALGALANFATEQGDWAEAEALHREGAGMWQALDNPLGVASRLEGLGVLRVKQGDPAAAATLLEQSLELNRRFGTQRHVSNSLQLLGMAKLHQDEVSEARRLIEEAMAIDTAEKNHSGVSNALSTLGLLCEEQGDYTTALSSYEESLAIREALCHRSAAARARLNVAEVLMLQGDVARAGHLYAEGLTALRTQGDCLSAARALDGPAVLAAAHARHEQALRLAGAGAALRGAAPAGERRVLQRRLDAALAGARDAIGADAADRAYQAGAALSLETATEEAVAVGETIVPLR